MKMTFRWYGENDSVTLEKIRQLYDRALGAMYINGLWEAIEKGAKK